MSCTSPSVRVLTGDCRTILAELPSDSVQCVVTSPPYFQQLDYQVDGQIGLEQTLDGYVAEMVAVFREVRRVLHPTGVCWLNLGDSFGGPTGYAGDDCASNANSLSRGRRGAKAAGQRIRPGKRKDLLMVPARVALALQDDGWWLRSDCIWHKPACMPERVSDRPTSCHEHVFLLTRRSNYLYHADAIREPTTDGTGSRNCRNVWSFSTSQFRSLHSATMPASLVERCILAGSLPGDLVLDPFGGAGTTGLVAARLGRDAVLIELNPSYVEIAERRIAPSLAA